MQEMSLQLNILHSSVAGLTDIKDSMQQTLNQQIECIMALEKSLEQLRGKPHIYTELVSPDKEEQFNSQNTTNKPTD